MMSSFSLILIPDTQVAIQDWPEVSYVQGDWIARNAQDLNIAAVVHVGDMVEWPRDADWQRFSEMMAKIDHLVVSRAPGNHDFDHWNDQMADILRGKGDRSLERFRRYFPLSRSKNVVSSFPAGLAGNVAQSFEAGGMRWLVVSLSYWPSKSELQWLDQVLTQNPDKRAIINTHDYMKQDDRTAVGEAIWAVAKKHRTVSFIFNGHWYPESGHRVDEGDEDNPVYQIMSDYQDYNNRNPNSYLKIITVDPTAGTVKVKTYSPFLDKHMTGDQHDFHLDNCEFPPVSDPVPDPEPAPNPEPAPLPAPEGKMRRYPDVETGPVGEKIIAFAEKYYPKASELYVTSGMDGDHGATSHHYGKVWDDSPTAAIDFGAYDGVGVAEGQRRMRDFAQWADEKLRPYIAELIHTTPYDTDDGFYVTYGHRSSFDAGTRASHLNHVHLAFSDASLAQAIGVMSGEIPAPVPQPTPEPSASLFGLDYSFSRPSMSAMKSANVKFVSRYLSQVNNATRPKLLTRSEAESLTNAGIAVISNFEWYPDRCTEGFNAGAADARIALEQAQEVGMPAGRPIYFSVDIDVPANRVDDYFRGILSVMPVTQVGVYGSYEVCRDLHAANLVSWLWQTYAWSDGQWYEGNHFEQYSNNEDLGGASVDFNRSKKADFGQWFVGGNPTPVPTPTPIPGDDELKLTDPVPSASTTDNPNRTLNQVLGDVWQGVHWRMPVLQSKLDEIDLEIEALKSVTTPEPTPVPAPAPVSTTPASTGFNPSKYAKAIAAAVVAGVSTYTALKTGGMTADEWNQVWVTVLAALGITWAVPNKDSK